MSIVATPNITVTPVGTGLWPNEPTGWSLFVDRAMAVSNPVTDDSTGANWFINYQEAGFSIVSNESGEPKSPSSAYRYEWSTSNEGGPRQDYIPIPGGMRKCWIGWTVKTENWYGDTSGAGVTKVFWMPLPSAMIVKFDGTPDTGPFRFRFTREDLLPTINIDSGDGGTPVNIVNDTWYGCEAIIERPQTTGPGRLRLWVNDTLTIDATPDLPGSPFSPEFHIQPYKGGLDGPAPPRVDAFLLGHVKVRLAP